MRHVFVINPVAGKQNPGEWLEPKIRVAAQAEGIQPEIIYTQKAGDGVAIAQRLGEQGQPVRLYACGGDGTLNELLSGGYRYPSLEMACVPCGSGNDFVRNYGTQEEFLDIADQIRGRAVPIDLIETPLGVSAAICSAGLDAQVAYGIPKFRRLPLCGGTMAYTLSILQNLCGHLGHRLRLTLDEEVLEMNCLLVALCNGRAYGGGYLAAPEAAMDDGLLDVIVIEKISRLRMASVLKVYKNGKHLKNGVPQPPLADVMQYRRVRYAKLEPLDGRPIVVTLDGECSLQPGIEVKVLPKAARVVLPGRTYRRQKEAKNAAVRIDCTESCQ